ncbi:MAG: RNA polymerase sigma factor [Planctomycetota bacterium]|nr:MAG: RNA polymerase sigma factor [Planctomycetota bacterium]
MKSPEPLTNEPNAERGIVDAEQVRRAQAGDRDAREAIFANNWPICVRVARRMTGSDEDAGDVVQDAFVKALNNLERFDHRSTFRTWLLRIVTNCATDHLRRNRRRSQLFKMTGWTIGERQSTPEPSQIIDPGKSLEQRDLRQEIDSALAQLSETTRGAFVLYAEAEMTYQEVADTLSVPIGTIMSRIHSARKKLQVVAKDLDNTMPPRSDTPAHSTDKNQVVFDPASSTHSLRKHTQSMLPDSFQRLVALGFQP